jgi:hypothetical protein
VSTEVRDPEQPNLRRRRRRRRITGDLSQHALDARLSALLGVRVDGGGGREMMEGSSGVVDGDAMGGEGRGKDGFEEGGCDGALFVAGFVGA